MHLFSIFHFVVFLCRYLTTTTTTTIDPPLSLLFNMPSNVLINCALTKVCGGDLGLTVKNSSAEI